MCDSPEKHLNETGSICLLNSSPNCVTIFWDQAQNPPPLSAQTQDRAKFYQILQNILDFKILLDEGVWPYFGEKSFLPFLPPGNKTTHISMNYLLKPEWFHWDSELALRLAEPCTVTWETRWPIFYIFVCKRGAAQSLVPYRFPQATDCFFCQVFLGVCLFGLVFLWYEYSYYYY